MAKSIETNNEHDYGLQIRVYYRTRNMCLILTEDGAPYLELSVEVHDFLPFNYVVANTAFLPEAVKKCFETQFSGKRVGEYYKDGKEYPMYEVDKDKLKAVAHSDFTDYLYARIEKNWVEVCKEFYDEHMKQEQLKIIENNKLRANELSEKKYVK